MDESEDDSLKSLSKFTLFETKSRFYITASTATTHRVLKIDRTDPTALNVVEDATTYDGAELDLLLRMVQDGNKSQGGLEKVLEFHGIVGFVKFTAGWYLVLITKRSVVGLLGGHYIYHCDETTLLTVASKSERTTQETKSVFPHYAHIPADNRQDAQHLSACRPFQELLLLVFLRHHQYFADQSHGRRIQSAVEHPFHVEPSPFIASLRPEGAERKESVGSTFDPWLHGSSQDQCLHPDCLFDDHCEEIQALCWSAISHQGGKRAFEHLDLTSRAGSDIYTQGHVANEVETEQIVSEPLATPFGAKSSNLHLAADFAAGYGGYTSFVQYRGSIPVMWQQESSQMTPRPPIEITIRDPFYTPAAKHFDDLLGRYGAPIFILNLIKWRETVPRESKLLFEYGQCVSYLNQFLPADKKMRYIAWDMAQAAKSGHQDVMGVLEDVCEESLQATDFFHGGPARNDFESGPRRDQPSLQHGILRVNCVDCLDRTNAAQFAIAKRAFGHQLYALGLLATPNLPFSCDAVDVLTEMFHDHGDTLAWQYTGSALVNRVDTYRRTKAAQWSSHSRDLLENIRRFYNNSMLDADKQAAINLFLGVEPSVPSYKLERPHYRQWFTPSHLEPPAMDELAPINQVFREYYKPHILSQFGRLYAFTMNSTTRFTTKPKSEMLASPFESRIPIDLASSTTSLAPLRRSARRWANPVEAPGRNRSDSPNADDRDLPTPFRDEPHPIEVLVASLLDPPDVHQRIQEYDWYTHYHANDLSSQTLGEEKDLQVYVRAARLAEGEDIDRLLGSNEGIAWSAQGNEDITTANAQFYESWLKA